MIEKVEKLNVRSVGSGITRDTAPVSPPDVV